MFEDPASNRRRYHPRVIELGHAVEIAQRLERDRDVHVRSLTGDPRTIRSVEPLPTDLAEGVGPPLGGGAVSVVSG